METNSLIITPKTKVLQLIETYPELEDVLISYVPAFKKLRNPVLRKTVARIASLQQAATIGNVKIEDLINLLRKKVGQDAVTIAGENKYVTELPSWFDENRVVKETDIRKMLDAGEQPVNQVLSDLHKLEPGVIYKIISPFIPAPLIDKAASLNMEHWVKKENDELFLVFFMRSPVG